MKITENTNNLLNWIYGKAVQDQDAEKIHYVGKLLNNDCLGCYATISSIKKEVGASKIDVVTKVHILHDLEKMIRQAYNQEVLR